MKAKQQIKVFISSTFIDMQGERDYLVKKIFPSIKAECNRRGVDFIALDLRWGINEEDARSGKVVEICMDEIDRSRPFFIGLLGGRYGWIPKKEDDIMTEKILTKYPWIEKYAQDRLSITEMEMQFGVLNNPDSVNAYFFQKEDTYIAKKFKEKKNSEEANKLERLKTNIRNAADEGLCELYSYSSMKILGEQVYNALMKRINELYPVEKVSNFELYSRRQNDFYENLKNVYIRYEEAPLLEGKLLIVGDRGIGKSAFIANHAAEGLKENYHVIYTVVNNDVNSAEMCRRMLLYELSCLVSGIDIKCLDEPLDSKVNVKKILESAGFEGNVRWVLDGIDKLAAHNERDAVWLSELPSQISEIILTASDPNGISSVIVQEYTTIKIAPLKPGEIIEITKIYLKGFAKALSDVQEAHISNSVLLNNPRTLMVFLKELLQFGVHEKLGDFINSYLSAKTTEELYMRVLERLDNDFGFSRMKEVFGWIIMCENGVPMDTLVHHLNVNNIEWVAIHEAITPFLSMNLGYIIMDDDDMSDAAERHYDIPSLRINRNFVNKLAGALKKENKKLFRASKAIIYKKNGFTSYIFSRLFNCLLHPIIGNQFFIDEAGGHDRYIKNGMSILSLYVKANMRRAYLRYINKIGLVGLLQSGTPGLILITEILNDKRNSITQFVTVNMAVLSHCGLEFSISSLFLPILNVYNDLIRRDTEAKKLIKKLERFHYSSAEIKQVKSLIEVTQDGVSIEELLDTENLDLVIMQIAVELVNLFYIVSISKLKRITNKALVRVAGLAEDDIMRNVLYLIVGICKMRLDEPDSDKYIIASSNDVLSKNKAPAVYITLDLFRAVKTNDKDAIKHLSEIVSSYKGNGQFVLESTYYLVKYVECAYSEDMDIDVLSDEFAQMAMKYNRLVDASFNLGIYLYNMKLYHISSYLFERSVTEYNDSDYDNRIGALRFAAISRLKCGNYQEAEDLLLKAIEIKKNHPDETQRNPLYGLYDDMESICRESGKYMEAFKYAKEMVTLLNKEGDTARMSGTYNLLGVNASAVMYSDISKEEKKRYFQEAYNAFVKSEKYNGNYDTSTTITNRANLVFEAVNDIPDVSMKYVDETIYILERLILDENADNLNRICSVLSKGYLIKENWTGLKRLIDKFNLNNEVICKNIYKITYNCVEDKNNALSVIADNLVKEIFQGRNSTYDYVEKKIRPAPERCQEVKEMGIVDPLVKYMYDKASSDRHDAILYANAMVVLGDETRNEEVIQLGYKLECKILMNVPEAFCYFDRLSKRDRLKEMLIDAGWSQSDFNDKTAKESVRRVCQERAFVDVDIAISDIFRSSDITGLMTELLEAILKEDSISSAAWSCLYNIREHLEDLTDHLSRTNQSDAVRLKRLIDKFTKSCCESIVASDKYKINTLSEIREALDLECDPYLIIWKMIICYDNSDEVLKLWEDTPSCHQSRLCQGLYLEALRLSNQYEEAERKAEDFFKTTSSDEERLPLAMQLILIFRNTGRYEKAYNLLEHYSQIDNELNTSFLKEILLAYTGNIDEALLMCEQRFDNTSSCKYAKAIYLLKMGLINDAEKVISSAETVNQDNPDWLFVLYLIELSRYWKNEGNISKAKAILAKARKYMNVIHMGMCEYEAAHLGLD